MTLQLSSYRSLGEAFQARLKQHDKRLALIEVDRDSESGRYSYEQVAQEAMRVAALLQERGFSAGDRCAIVMSNQARWIISAIAIFLAGGVVVPIDCRASPHDQWSYLKHCKFHMIITEWPIWRRWREERVNLPPGKVVWVIAVPEETELQGALRWERSPSVPFEFKPRLQQDPCAILYSSGTGGKMKGCILTHRNYLSQVENFSAYVNMRPDDRYLSILPTNHGIDFVFGFLYPMLLGATVVHQRALRPQYLLSTLRDYQITSTSFVPLILREMQKKISLQLEGLSPLKKKAFRGLVWLNRLATRKPRHWVSKRLFPKIHQAFGGKLRMVMTGGSFVDPKLAKFFYELGFYIGIGYGLTEAGTTVSAPFWGKYYDDNVGRPLPHTEIKIANPDANGVGEIWVRSPSVMAGYFEDPELTAETLVDGWLRTGDLGAIDTEGNLRIKGRVKNIIVTAGGENIYPEDVESSFELPEAKEFCVFGTSYLWPNISLLDEKLFLVVHPEDEGKVETIVAQVVAQNRILSEQKRISGFLEWEEDFPRTGSLKVMRHLLAQKIADAKSPQDIHPFHRKGAL